MIGAALRAWIGAWAIASQGTAGLAQMSPPPSDDIVVIGTKARPRAIEQAARAVTPPGDLHHTPLARFQAPVCPGIVGMPDDFAAEMVARIRTIADQARIRITPPGRCKANLLVIFVPNGQAALQSMRGKGPWPFGAIAPSELRDLAADPALKDLAADPGPVHAWVSTEIRNRYGEALQGQDNLGEPGMLKTSDSLSRIAMTVRQDIVASVVVIDSNAVQGMPAAQIADYVAMRGLVRTRPPGQPGAVGTILSLFDKGAIPPPEMTRFDRAYLRAAYGSAPNIAGITKIAQVAREVKKGTGEE
jgi:hypothetical protein